MRALRFNFSQYLHPKDLRALQTMRTDKAAQWIEQFHPGMPQEMKEDLLAMVESCQPDLLLGPMHPNTMPKAYFIAAAWMAGASWGQLSKMFQVARSTLARTAERRYGYMTDRHALRTNRLVSYEQLTAMWDVFKTILKDSPQVAIQTPSEKLGEILWAKAQVVGNELDTDPISNMPIPDRKMPTVE